MKTKNTIQLIITGFLIMTLIGIVRYQFDRLRWQKRVAAQASGVSTPPVTPQVEEPNLFAQLSTEAKQLKFKRDPFYRESLPEPPQEPVLMGIAWEEANPTAIIDNVIVRVGDKVGDKTVVAIFEDSVTLTDGEHLTKLFLGP